VATRRSNKNGSARTTTDHDEIRAWAEERGGQPSVVASTRNSRGPGILRIDFPGFSGEGSLKPLSWDDFFERFDQANLAFLYQDATTSGRRSRFNKFVAREGAAEQDEASRASTRRSSASSRRTGRSSAGTRGGTQSRTAKKNTARKGVSSGRQASSGGRKSSRSSSTATRTARKTSARGKAAGTGSAQGRSARGGSTGTRSKSASARSTGSRGASKKRSASTSRKR
jgi:hypothetical protein